MGLIKSQDEIYRERLIECAKHVQAEYSRCCRPIYGIMSDNTEEHIGSAVLIKNGGKRYIVTASHVYDKRANAKLFISIGQEKIILKNDFYQTDKVEERRIRQIVS